MMEAMIPFGDQSPTSDDDDAVFSISYPVVKPALCTIQFTGVKTGFVG
jgi:hypothetical protein